MFTGLIEDIGKVKEIKNVLNGKIFAVSVNFGTEDLKIGDSIAINGVCETLIDKKNNILYFEAMKETIERSNFKFLKENDFVNIERAMTLNSRLDGHLVSGHIDCCSKIIKIKENGVQKDFEIEADTSLIVEKGSIALNGISLTVSGVSISSFTVSILPYTLNNTNLKYLKQNDFVNVEYDMLAKYIKKFTSPENKTKITEEFLIQNGF